MYLFPRLPDAQANELADGVARATLADLFACGTTTHPKAVTPQLGYPPAPQSLITELQGSIRAIAARRGFPSGADHAGFDDDVIDYLGGLPIPPSDAGAEGVWSFLSLVVLPEIGPWRFPSLERRRLLGTPRNPLRRLWIRGYLLRDETRPEDRHWLAKEISEDAAQQIIERPTLSSNPRLALALAVFWSSVVRNIASGGQDRYLRDVAKRLIRLTPYQALDFLSDEAIQVVLVREASASAEALGITIPRLEPPVPRANLIRPEGAVVLGTIEVGAVIDGFGAAVRERRGALRMTQAALADLLQIAQPTLSNVELGRARPSIQLHDRIVLALGMNRPAASGMPSPESHEVPVGAELPVDRDRATADGVGSAEYAASDAADFQIRIGTNTISITTTALSARMQAAAHAQHSDLPVELLDASGLVLLTVPAGL